MRRVTAEDAALMVQAYSEGKLVKEIARETGWSTNTVSKTLKKHGVEIRNIGGFGRVRRESHPNWKGGRHIKDGYVSVAVPIDDPLRVMSVRRGYVLEHRLVMARHLGRPLLPTETVHHIDGDPQNNDLSNLELRQGRHGRGVSFVCIDCGSRNVQATNLAKAEA